MDPTKRFRSEEDVDRDFVSKLPDELLGLILSRLTLEEAVRTTLLSKRWVSALGLFSGTLYFHSYLLRRFSYPLSDCELQHRFVSLVNRVLFNSLRSPTFQLFIVQFFLRSDSASDLDNWLLFAFRKSVEVLDLDLGLTCYCPRDPHLKRDYRERYHNYSFPVHLFSHSTFASLKFLRFEYVEVSEEAIHWFLNNCPNLERVRLRCGCLTELVTLRVSVPSLKLTHLDLVCNDNIKLTDLVISAGTLVSLEISAPSPKQTRFSLDNAPFLVQSGFRGLLGAHVIDYPTQFSYILTKLEALKLTIRKERWKYELLQLNNLKHLELTVVLLSMPRPLQLWCSFLKGAPFLRRLTLKFMLGRDTEPTRELEKVREESPYKELKEVKVCGFKEDTRVREFIIYLAENSLSLEKFVVHTCSLSSDGMCCQSENHQARTESALHLKSQLPATLNYIVL